MNGSIAILVVATASAGYIISSKCVKYRYKIARQSGHRLYLSSLTLGTYSLFFAILTTWLFLPKSYSDNAHFITAIVTVFSALTYTELYNRNPNYKSIFTILKSFNNNGLKNTISKLSKEIKEDKEDNIRGIQALWRAWQDNDFELICAHALFNLKPVAVTLDSNKVYVGMVADSIEPSDGESYLSLLPLYSGHRDKDSQSFKLDRKYTSIIDGLLKQDPSILNSKLDYIIAIPTERIVTMHIFNEDLYQEVSGSSTTDIENN
ncbi:MULTISPECIES: hypothetical protein [Nitrincola]|uniref:Uncharacterized protein n=1 Tax=Nitrincola nitratireducens TaxID=1229521 RepID=W9UZ41_9GAMM|nr:MULTISPECIES: hypothetical protein [Nitrincola]EXJ12508.1 hypothetical protein D791_00753 [Nitrincola nitratireducens]